MVRNDDYWGDKPHLDAIIYKFIADGTTAQLAFQNGEAEAISVMSGGQNLATDLEPLGYKVLVSQSGELLTFVPSVTNPESPLANVKVRQAKNTPSIKLQSPRTSARDISTLHINLPVELNQPILPISRDGYIILIKPENFSPKLDTPMVSRPPCLLPASWPEMRCPRYRLT